MKTVTYHYSEQDKFLALSWSRKTKRANSHISAALGRIDANAEVDFSDGQVSVMFSGSPDQMLELASRLMNFGREIESLAQKAQSRK